MELLLACSNCNHPIPPKENYFFCSKCLAQVKCKNCGEILEKDALGCSSCGTAAVEKQRERIAVNTIEFEQKGDNKKFKANFTDQVGENLVASLNGLFLGQSVNIKSNQNPFTQSKNGQLTAHGATQSKPESKVEDAIIVDSSKNDLDASLTKIFRNDEDKITLVNSRLKQTGKKDHAIRITLLLLYAYSLTEKQQVKRSLIVDALQSSAVYDKNYISWLSKCDEIKKIDGDFLELNLPGRDAALEILKEFNNPTIEKGSVHFSSGTGKAKYKSKKSKPNNETTIGESVSNGKSSGSNSKMQPAKMIDILFAEKYFSEKRRVPDILKYCKDIKGHTLDMTTLSTALLRKVKNGTLKREQNTADNQYDYYQ